MMKKKKVSSYERIRARYGYMFISLWLVGFVIFFLLPFVTSVIYSFNSVKVEIGEVKLTPVGFDNYIGLFLENEEFLQPCRCRFRKRDDCLRCIQQSNDRV